MSETTARWIEENTRTKSYKFVCSACGKVAYDTPICGDKHWATKRPCSLQYCPHCGAKMDLGPKKTPTDGEALKALKTLTEYCGCVSCGDCKIKKIVHCDYDKEWSEEMMAIPMYWDSELLKKLEKEEANANVECAE